MGKFKLTLDQAKILESQDKNLLVSASAGSGKTATLIEKIFDLVVNKQVDLSNVLVITFTESASSEMKTRLRKKFFEFASNIRVREQMEELNSSYICTLHSLCSKLLKRYFYVLDLNPNFVVLNEENAKFLKVKALEETFSYYENNNDENFDNLSLIFGGRDLIGFKKEILAYHDFLCSLKNREDFVNKKFKCAYDVNLDKNIAGKLLNEYILDNFYYYKKSFEFFLTKAGQLKANYFANFLAENIKKLETLSYEKSFLENRKLLTNLEFLKIQQKNLTDEDKLFLEEFKVFYSEFEDKIDDIKKIVFCDESKDEIAEKLQNATKFLEKFNDVEKEFESKYSKIKQNKNALDFNDLEKFMLILLDDERVKKEINNEFKFVFVDEYQDINEVQESILQNINLNANMVMVGDVKQSIYGFRNSTPNIFIDKSLKYSQNETDGKIVLLNENFRSKKEILNFVNSIFSKIMVLNFGGVDYKEKGMLKGKIEFESNALPTIKLCLIDKSKKEEEIEESFNGVYSVLEDKNLYFKKLSPERKEAMIIANNILNMVGKQKYYDAQEKVFKVIQYKDIAILARSNEFLKNVCLVLEEYKIPVSTNKVENIFLNQDVYVLLCLLKLLSSTHDDISLATVLTSIFGGLTHDDLAVVKRETLEEKFFYLSVKKYLYEGKNEDIKAKIKNFFNLINELSKKVYSSFSIYDIFMLLDNQFNFLAELACLPGGEERVKIVRNYIESFYGTEYNLDLEKYLNYVENFEQDNKFVSSLNTSDDSVNVGTIHSSKGLEYPVVIVCGLDKNFSNKTFVSPVLKDCNLGIGFSSYDLTTFVKSDNLAKSAFLVSLRKKEKAEELRLLYVALTRAKNNLILVGHVALKALKQVENYRDAQNCNSYMPWVLGGLSKIGFEAIKNNKKEFVDKNKDFEVFVEVRDSEDFVLDKEINKDIKFLFKQYESVEFLKRVIDFEFGKPNNIALKNTVSSLLQEQNNDEQSSVNLAPQKLTIFENSLDKSKLGTYYHKLMQEVDFLRKDCADTEYLHNILSNLNLEENYAKEIDLKSVKKCVESIKSLKPISVLKEQQFLSYFRYCDVFKDSQIKDKVLIQGVVDLIVKTNDGYYVIDYKTNKVAIPDQLVEKYGLQLKLYKQSIEKAMNISIENTLIYSFCLNKFIKIY